MALGTGASASPRGTAVGAALGDVAASVAPPQAPNQTATRTPTAPSRMRASYTCLRPPSYCGGGTGGISNTSHAGVWLFSPGGWFHK